MKFSLEFFPPRSNEALKRLSKIMPRFADIEPEFITVTYKAGGASQSRTLAMLSWLQAETTITPVSHLTYIGMEKERIYEYVETLLDKGVNHILALRGDAPEGYRAGDCAGDAFYQYTNEFIEDLKIRYDLDISVATYPDKHPLSPSLQADIEILKKKYEAGANRAITQFFFDNDVFYSFLEEVGKSGLDIPVIPGILPVTNFEKTLRFIRKYTGSVPPRLEETYNDHAHDPEYLSHFAEDLLVEQCTGLMEHGIGHIHFYTLNHVGILARALRTIKQ